MSVMTMPAVELDETFEPARVRRDVFLPRAEADAAFYAALAGDRKAIRRMNKQYRRAQHTGARKH